jgi:hypothetical protein
MATAELVHLLNGGYVAVRRDEKHGRVGLSAEAGPGSVRSSVRMELSVAEARKLAGELVEAAMLVAGAEREEGSERG